jgi:hypothetical protein
VCSLTQNDVVELTLSGPGNCLGLLAGKSGPTAVRGQYYGFAAAVGKVGAFVGTWGVFCCVHYVTSILIYPSYSFSAYDKRYTFPFTRSHKPPL